MLQDHLSYFLLLSQNQSFVQENPVSFWLRRVLETKIWELGVLITIVFQVSHFFFFETEFLGSILQQLQIPIPSFTPKGWWWLLALSVVDLFSDLAELIMWHLFPPQWAAPLIHTYISPLVFAFKPVYLRTSLCRRPGFNPWVGKIPWRRKWQLNPGILDCRIPWREEPGRLQSMGFQRVRHD